MAKPADLPVWDTNETNSIEPPASRQDDGWLAPSGVPEKPPYQWFNWWMNNVYKWIEYLDDAVGTPFASGTVMLFGQASAPVGWTKKTDWSDNAMMTVNTQADGTALASGGSANPQSAHNHSVGSHIHTMPSHSHGAGTLRFKLFESDMGASTLRGERQTSGQYNNFISQLFNATVAAGTAVKLLYVNQTYDDYYSWTNSGIGNTQSVDPGDTNSANLGNTADNTQFLYQEIIACTKD